MEEKDTTKKKLLRAGIKLFSQYGYAATTTRMIAAEADVNLSAIAFHYKNKECLYAACLEYMHDKIKSYYEDSYTAIEEAITEGSVTKEKAYEFLKKLIDLQIEAAFGQQYQTTLALVYQEGCGPEGIYPLSSVVFKRQEGVMAKLLQILAPVSDEKAMVDSRFINGSIIAFGEHGNLIKPYILKKDKSAEFPDWVKAEIRENCLAIVRRYMERPEEPSGED